MAVTEDLTFRMNFVGNAVPQMKRVQTEMRRVSQQTAVATQAINRHAGSYNFAAVSTNKWAKGALQQAGYQVGDFAVQVANGTSKMQAFGQQGSQLLGIFGPIGAVLGAGIAIFSAIAVAFEKSRKGAEQASGEIDDLSSSVSDYSSAVSRAITPTSDLADEYGSAAEKARELFQANAQLKQLDAIEALTASARRLQSEFGDFGGRTSTEIERVGGVIVRLREKIDDLRAEELRLLADPEADAFRLSQIGPQIAEAQSALLALGGTTEIISTLQNKLGVGAQEALNFAQNLAKINEAGSPQELSDAIDSARASFTELVGGAENMNDEQRDLLRQLVMTSIEALNLNTNMNKAAEGISGASDEADGLASSLGSAGDQAARISRLMERFKGDSAIVFDPRDPRYDERLARFASIMEDMQSSYGTTSPFAEIEEDIKSATGAVGGLSSAADTSLSSMDAMFEELEQTTKTLSSSISSTMSSAFMSIMNGTKSTGEAVREMLRSIIAKLFEMLVLNRLINTITGAFGLPPTLPTFGAKTFDGGGYTGSGGRSGGIDGKGGFPAILHPNETVIDHTKGGGAGGVTVIQNNTFGSGVSRAEIQSMLPKIVETTKAAVVDAQRRSVNGFA